MTTQEIRDLIASKIAGQGSAVDAGSALPEILNGIVDALEEAAGNTKYQPLMFNGEFFSNVSKATAIQKLKITEGQFEDLIAGRYPFVIDSIDSMGYSLVATQLKITETDKPYIDFLCTNEHQEAITCRSLRENNDGTWSFFEV